MEEKQFPHREHKSDRTCEFPKCIRLGNPFKCKTCGEIARRRFCPKHRKPKFIGVRPTAPL